MPGKWDQIAHSVWSGWLHRWGIISASPERWPSGRRRRPAKALYGLKPVSRVRIPSSPPKSTRALRLHKGRDRGRGGEAVGRGEAAQTSSHAEKPEPMNTATRPIVITRRSG